MDKVNDFDKVFSEGSEMGIYTNDLALDEVYLSPV